MSLKWIRFLGAGFQLLIQTDNNPAIYADAAARDVYFATPNGILDLARMDANEFLIIKLLDNGSGEIAYQQRQGAVFVDVTSLIQGEDGPPGASGDSFFFSSETDRDTFFNGSPSLLKADLPVMVNEDETVTIFVWKGGTAPASYDADLFRPASLGASPGSLTLGLDGYNISSGGRILDHRDAYGDAAFSVLTRHDASGSTPPSTFELSPQTEVSYAPIFDTQLVGPQEMLFMVDEDKLVHQFGFRPAEPGDLRFQAFAGILDTNPVLIDKTITVNPGDIGNTLVINTDNQLLGFEGDNILLRFSGPEVRGGFQTSGPFGGQTVPFLFTNEHVALETEVAVFGSEEQLTFPDGSSQKTAPEDKQRYQVSTLKALSITNLDAGNATPVAFYFGNFGRKLFVMSFSANLFEYDLSVPFDTTTIVLNTSVPIAEDTQKQGLWVSDDGRTIFIGGGITDTVYEYSLSTPFSLSTLTYTGNFLSVASEETAIGGLAVSGDAKKLFIVGGGGLVFEYTLPNTGTLLNSSYSGNSFDISPPVVSAVGFGMLPDGKSYFVGDFSTSLINQFDMAVPFDITTSRFIGSSEDFGIANIRGFEWTPSGDKFFALDLTNLNIHEFGGGLDVKGKILGEIETQEPAIITFPDQTTQINAGQPNDDHWYASPMTLGAVTPITGFVSPSGVSVPPDGDRLFTINTAGAISGYDLTTPWDSSTHVQTETNTLTEETGYAGIHMLPDLSRFFTLGSQTDTLLAYDMSTPGDVTTAVDSGEAINVGAQDATPRAIVISVDGTKAYYIGAASVIFQYDLPKPYTLVGGVFSGKSFSVAAQSAVSVVLGFSHDGRNMYVGDFTNDQIFHWRLTVPWEVDTAKFVDNTDVLAVANMRGISFNPDGTRGIIADLSNSTFSNIDLGINVKGKIIGNIESDPVKIFEDGSTQFIAALPDLTRGRLPTAATKNIFDISSLDTNPTGLFLTRDGKKIFLVGNSSKRIISWDLSTAWDTDTATLAGFIDVTPLTNPSGLDFKPDGLRMFVIGSGTDSIAQFDLSVPFDVTTAVFDDDLDLGSTDNTPFSLVFHPAGTSFYFVGIDNATVFRFDMSTPWDVTTGVVSTDEFVHGLEFGVVAVNIRSDGAIMYLSDDDGKNYDYLLPEPWNVSSAELLSTTDLSDQGLAVTRGIYVSPSGHKVFFASTADDSIHEFDLGILSEGPIIGKGNSFNGPSTFEIHSAADWEALAVAGVITISSQTTIKILARFETASVINVIGDDLTITGDNDENSTITYTGSGTFVTVTGDFVFRTNAALFLTATGGGTLVSFTGASVLTGGVSIIDSNLRGWADLGTITRGFLNLINTPLVAYSAPFKLVDSFATGTISSVFGGVAIDFNWNDPTFSLDSSINVNGFSSFSALTRISAFIPENVSVLIPIGNTGDSNVALFDTTGGSTGTYVSILQREMPLGIITSIADDGSGNASFTIPTPPVVGQIVTISGFIINTAYNGTFRTTSVGAGVFEVEDLSSGVQVPFGTNEAGIGVASGPGIEVSSVGHGLSNGDKIQLSSDLSTRYDGGYEVFSAQANFFVVSATFVDTQTGTWDTSPIDQTNPNVLAFDVVDGPKSHAIACAHVNNNTAVNGAIVNNTFTAMVFGTAGSALIQSSTSERWKLVDEIAGVFEYTGNEPFDNSIQFDFTVTSSGGTVDFRFKWEIDTGSGFGNLPDDVEALLSVGSDAQGVTKKFPLKAVKGNQIRPRITRNSGGSGITTMYATIFAGV